MPSLLQGYLLHAKLTTIDTSTSKQRKQDCSCLSTQWIFRAYEAAEKASPVQIGGVGLITAARRAAYEQNSPRIELLEDLVKGRISESKARCGGMVTLRFELFEDKEHDVGEGDSVSAIWDLETYVSLADISKRLYVKGAFSRKMGGHNI